MFNISVTVFLSFEVYSELFHYFNLILTEQTQSDEHQSLCFGLYSKIFLQLSQTEPWM